jgi:hypothetical protein
MKNLIIRKGTVSFLLYKNVDISCVLYKLFPLAEVVVGIASGGPGCTSGCFGPARPVFPLRRFLQGEKIA